MLKFLNLNTVKARLWDDLAKMYVNYEIIIAIFRCSALTSLSLPTTHSYTHTKTHRNRYVTQWVLDGLFGKDDLFEVRMLYW